MAGPNNKEKGWGETTMAKAKKPLNIGMIGYGFMGRAHSNAWRKVGNFFDLEYQPVLKAVAARNQGKAADFAARWGYESIESDWRDLVARDDIDAVLIGTWPYLHRPVSVAALKAGKHVFCQARMAMNYAEAREMHEAARASGRVAMVCPVPFGLTKDATMQRYLKSGRLGEVRLVRVQSMSSVFADPATSMTWRKDHRLSGLNMFTLGMYIELIHRWFGWTRTVSALTQTFVPERVDPSGKRMHVQIPDQVLFNTILENGTPVQYVISAAVHHGHDQIEVHGSKWTLQYEVNEDVLFGAAPGQPMGSATLDTDDEYDGANWRVEQDFVDAIREGKEYHPSFEDGMKYMQVIEAVYDSAREGRTIQID